MPYLVLSLYRSQRGPAYTRAPPALANGKLSMLNVQCPSCSAPYSLSEKRVPANGMKMRCPKCGSSFTVMQDGTVNGSEPPPSAAPNAAPSVGAPAPPPKKKPLFAPRPAPEIPLADPFGAELDLGLPETPNLGGLDDGGDFGSIDLGLDAGLPDPGATDLPAPAGFKDLPAPAAAARPPRAPAPPTCRARG